ncbi:class F sortase [Saccharopolyspora phatthalungensis]|uniref:class F sortase n=1 Tax=Saccharopolyspora phatthalungensis TaxID=664693 RepID=UPI0016208794|nr:class F sortase [Saccharopolyspora phatthalungensis]
MPEILLALGLMVGALGLGHALTSGPRLPHTGTVPVAHTERSSAPAAAQEKPVPASPNQVPQRVRLPPLGVDAPIRPVLPGPDRQLGVPESPGVVGWWSAGVAPGSRHGTVVLAGHVDSRRDGPGALFRVADLEPGDPVTVTTAQAALRYRIEAVRSYPKESLPEDVFDRTGRPRLVLITCGGTFDDSTRQYDHNIVAYAVPA